MSEYVMLKRDLLENCANYMEGSASGTVQLWHSELRAVLAQEAQHPILKVLNDPQAMELVGLKATVAQQAQLIEWLQEAGKVEAAYQTRWNSFGEWQEWKTVSHEQYQRSDGRLFERRVVNASQPAPVSTEPVRSFSDGIDAAAKLVEKRRDDYVNECGSFDQETGTVEFPGNGEEYVADLDEISEAIRCLDKVKELNP